MSDLSGWISNLKSRVEERVERDFQDKYQQQPRPIERETKTSRSMASSDVDYTQRYGFYSQEEKVDDSKLFDAPVFSRSTPHRDADSDDDDNDDRVTPMMNLLRAEGGVTSLNRSLETDHLDARERELRDRLARYAKLLNPKEARRNLRYFTIAVTGEAVVSPRSMKSPRKDGAAAPTSISPKAKKPETRAARSVPTTPRKRTEETRESEVAQVPNFAVPKIPVKKTAAVKKPASSLPTTPRRREAPREDQLQVSAAAAILAENEAIAKKLRKDSQQRAEEESKRIEQLKARERAIAMEKEKARMEIEITRERQRQEEEMRRHAASEAIRLKREEETRSKALREQKRREVEEAKRREAETRRRRIIEDGLALLYSKVKLRHLRRCFTGEEPLQLMTSDRLIGWSTVVERTHSSVSKFIHVREWRNRSSVFHQWKMRASAKRSDRESKDYALRALHVQQMEQVASTFHARRIISKHFNKWLGRARMASEEAEVKRQHQLRKMKMDVFVQKQNQPQATVPPTNAPPEGFWSPMVSMNYPGMIPMAQAVPVMLPNGQMEMPMYYPQMPFSAPPSQVNTPRPNAPTPRPKAAENLDPETQKIRNAQLALDAKAEERRERRRILQEKAAQSKEEARMKQEEMKREEAEKRKAEERAIIKQRQQEREERAAAAEKKRIELEKQAKLEADNREKAIRHDTAKKMRWSFTRWKALVVYRQRMYRTASDMFMSKLLIRCFDQWMDFSAASRERKFEHARDHFRRQLLIRCSMMKMGEDVREAEGRFQCKMYRKFFEYWRAVYLQRTAEKRQKADIYSAGYQLRFYFRRWKEYVTDSREDRAKQERRQMLRGKVSSWITEHREVTQRNIKPIIHSNSNKAERTFYLEPFRLPRVDTFPQACEWQHPTQTLEPKGEPLLSDFHIAAYSYSSFYSTLTFTREISGLSRIFWVVSSHPDTKQEPWIVGRTIGQGSSSKVKLGVNMETGKKVALKIIPPDESKKKRLENEINLHSQINHPNIAKLIECLDVDDGSSCIVVEYVQGMDLLDYLYTRPLAKMSEKEAVSIFSQIASAVLHLHDNGVVHRDVKLENIMIDSKGVCKIIDFGLASSWTPLRLLKTPCGSPNYAAPELLLRQPYDGPKTDVWSLGVLLYSLVSGRIPWEGRQTKEQLNHAVRGEWSPLDNVSSDLQDLISLCLVVEPDSRATMDEVMAHTWLKRAEKEERTKRRLSGTIKGIMLVQDTRSFEENDFIQVAQPMTDEKINTEVTLLVSELKKSQHPDSNQEPIDYSDRYSLPRYQLRHVGLTGVF
ncbi:hypothetical protein PROFUN_04558 [Planoprotostelium fungivorum]|uniref:non-specific serine/threonine protein kinase n=1 Tax=Planoprotostelium fungivorum TaxID=1890364 RepID=A0A2P6NBL5_9EUKA|nr:hypothetical protein PROFUN_04558 [Planoprotostelium fungivorum]